MEYTQSLFHRIIIHCGNEECDWMGQPCEIIDLFWTSPDQFMGEWDPEDSPTNRCMFCKRPGIAVSLEPIGLPFLFV
jgi:hypothetical protein